MPSSALYFPHSLLSFLHAYIRWSVPTVILFKSIVSTQFLYLFHLLTPLFFTLPLPLYLSLSPSSISNCASLLPHSCLLLDALLSSVLFCSPLFSCLSLSCLVLSSLPFLFLAVYSRISFSPLFLFFQQVHLLLSSLPFYLSIHQSFPLICSNLYFYSPLLLSSIVYLPVQHLSYSLLLSYLLFPFCLLLFTCLLFFLFLILFFLIYLSSFLCTSIYFLYQFTYLLPCVLLYQFTYFISSPLFFSINSTVYYLHQLT